MTPHPSRLALLISLMGFGLSASTQAIAEDGPSRDDVARVMQALGLDAAAENPDPDTPLAEPKLMWPAARPAQTDEQRALFALMGLEVIDVSHLLDTPQGLLPADGDAPAVPVPPPDAPSDTHVSVGLTNRPIEEPEDAELLLGGTWTLDGPPPRDEDAAAAVLQDAKDKPGDGLQTAEAPSEVAGEVVQAEPAEVDSIGPAHADRILHKLAGIRTFDGLSSDASVEEMAVDMPAAAASPSAGASRAAYVQARLAGDLESTGVSPTDRVLDMLAMFAGVPDMADETSPAPLWIAAEPEAEPATVAPMEEGGKPDAISPTQHMLDDLAALRGEPEAADEVEPARAPWDGETVAMNASRLEGVRGGFMTDTGLKLSFGIERAVYVNGTLVTTTSLNVADLSQLSAGQAAAAALNGGALAVVQSGAGNTFLNGASSVGTVIQNTLDNQHIQSVTTLNATVNSAEMLRSLNLQQSVQNAITNSLRR